MPKKMKMTESLVAATKSDSLFGASARVDPALASLFSSNATILPTQKVQSKSLSGKESTKDAKIQEQSSNASENDSDSSSSDELTSDESDDEDIDDHGSSTSEPSDSEREEEEVMSELEEGAKATDQAKVVTGLDDDQVKDSRHSRRKRKREEDDIEGKYLQRLAEEEEREEEQRQSKRQKEPESAEIQSDQINGKDSETRDDAVDEEKGEDDVEDEDEVEELSDFEIPKHETQVTPGESPEFEKANRTVFLGNVSSSSITSKVAKKTLLRHMSSFLEALPLEKESKTPHKLESIRFRSTAYTNLLPKKAAFAQQDLMEATSHSTNAYIVYSTKAAARAALKLNGTVVLDRHLRVDSVAHPAKSESKRCVFIGNLGFVDDESGAQQGDEKKKEKKQKEPGDTEEGLWREFSRCGVVENVRVIRDSKTRVGKGIAYVQFIDENAVEAALLYDGKKFPPLLPRKLRVTRAKTLKRNAAAKRELPPGRKTGNGVYNPKISSAQKSAQGRAGKLFGRSGAAMMNRPVRLQQPRVTGANNEAMGTHKATVGGAIKGPESFVFEGNRAKRSAQTGAKKVQKSKKKVGKPVNRSTKRAAAWRKTGGTA